MNSKLSKLLLLFLCVALLVSVGSFSVPVSAAAAFGFQASAVSDGAFSVTLSLPAVNWGAFDFTLGFDQNVVQMTGRASVKTVNDDEYEITTVRPTVDSANTTGNYMVNGVGTIGGDMTNSGTTITFSFTVKDVTASSTTINLTVNEFVDPATTAISIAAPSPLTVTLPGSGSTSSTTPPPSTSTTTDTPTTSTVTDTPTSSQTSTPIQTSTDVSTDPSTDSATDTSTQTPISTNTDTTTSTKTDASTQTSTKTSTPSENTSTKIDTDTDTETQSDTVTDTESLTDTETNFPMSFTSTDPETDVTDGTDTSTDASSAPGGSTVITGSSNPEPEPKPISTGMIALISLGAAVVFCGILTVIGLLRHKNEEE